jgi:hypothetical protein
MLPLLSPSQISLDPIKALEALRRAIEAYLVLENDGCVDLRRYMGVVDLSVNRLFAAEPRCSVRKKRSAWGCGGHVGFGKSSPFLPQQLCVGRRFYRKFDRCSGVSEGPFVGLQALSIGSNKEKLQKGLGVALVRGAQDTELTVEMDEDVRAWLADNAAQESFGELLPPLQMPVVDLSVNRLFAAAPVASILQKIRDAGLHATKHMCSWLYPSPWLMSVLRLLDRSYSSKA